MSLNERLQFMGLRICLRFWFVVAVTVLIAATHSEQSCAEELYRVLQELRANVQPIRSIEFQADREVSYSGPPLPENLGPKVLENAEVPTKSSYTYYWSGGKFRVDSDIGTGSRSSAFNGLVYQLFDSKQSARATSSNALDGPETPFPSPLAWAYFWVFPIGESLNFETLVSDSSWIQVGDESTLEADEAPGTTLLVVTKERPGKSDRYIYRVKLGNTESGGFIPLSWTSTLESSREVTYKLEVTETRQIAAADGNKLMFPISVNVERFGTRPSASKVAVAPETARINHSISDDVFDISPSTAKYSINLDDVNDSPGILDTSAEVSTSRVVSIAVTIGTIFLLAIAVLRKRFIDRKTSIN